MSLVLFALLSIAAAAVWAALSGALLWQAALFCVCCFLALNLLYVIFWVIVAMAGITGAISIFSLVAGVSSSVFSS